MRSPQGRRDGRDPQHGIVNGHSVEFSLGAPWTEGLQESSESVSPRYTQGKTSLEPFAKLKISGHASGMKTRVYKVSKEKTFFHPEPRSRHKCFLMTSPWRWVHRVSGPFLRRSWTCPALRVVQGKENGSQIRYSSHSGLRPSLSFFSRGC